MTASAAAFTIESPSKWGRRARAVILAVVWTLPGLWCTAQLLAHELGPAHDELHMATPGGDRITGINCNPDHGHSHPESSPAISPEGTKKFDTSVLVARAAEFDASSATSQRHRDAALWNPTRASATGSGPRAPPIS